MGAGDTKELRQISEAVIVRECEGDCGVMRVSEVLNRASRLIHQ